jgi:hypothetical protein
MNTAAANATMSAPAAFQRSARNARAFLSRTHIMASARRLGSRPSASPLPVARSRLIDSILPSVSKNSRFLSDIDARERPRENCDIRSILETARSRPLRYRERWRALGEGERISYINHLAESLATLVTRFGYSPLIIRAAKPASDLPHDTLGAPDSGANRRPVLRSRTGHFRSVYAPDFESGGQGVESLRARQ